MRDYRCLAVFWTTRPVLVLNKRPKVTVLKKLKNKYITVLKFIYKYFFSQIVVEAESIAEKSKRMRLNLFMDLFTTESNYVGILKTIVTVRTNLKILNELFIIKFIDDCLLFDSYFINHWKIWLTRQMPY